MTTADMTTAELSTLPGAGHGSRAGGATAASGSFLSGAGWLFSAQILARVARLATTLVVARVLTPEHFGIVAVALATHELATVVARFATTSALVRAAAATLGRDCRTAWTLNWLIGGALFALQCAIAVPVARLYDSPGVAAPIMVLALTYLLLPLGAVNQALTTRRGDMRRVAEAEVQQAVGDMALAVVLAVAGFGVWALILPKLAVVPLWIRVHRRASPWRPSGFSLDGARDLLRFGIGVVGVEALGVLRHSIDYLLIGLVLGVEALGLYFFAFNAGLGITRGLLSALNGALLPALCRGERTRRAVNARYVRGAGLVVAIVTAWVLLQTSLAAFYVPLVFGERWVAHGALPILVVIAFCGIPMALVESGSQYLRARGLPGRDLRWNAPYSLLFTAAVLGGLSHGTFGVACAVLVLNLVNAPLYLACNVAPVFRREHPHGTVVEGSSRGRSVDGARIAPDGALEKGAPTADNNGTIEGRGNDG